MRHVRQEQPDPVAGAIAEFPQSGSDAVRPVERLGKTVVTPEEIDQRCVAGACSGLVQEIHHRQGGEGTVPGGGMTIRFAPERFGSVH